MKSPFTGKEMKRVYEKRTWNFRGEEFEYFHTAWMCEDTKELFTSDESDDAGYIQVTNQYRNKYGIPFTDEIISVRNRYGISAAKMSVILGIGINQYRLYEHGEVPSVSNGRMIRSVMKPRVMLEMVESSRNELSKNEYERIVRKVKEAMFEEEQNIWGEYETMRVFDCTRGEENGFAQTSLPRLKNIMLYILGKCENVWCTKMNKLLFYLDFISYREHGQAMTGLKYRALEFGPVPDRWDIVYSSFPEIRQELREFGEFTGSIIKSVGTSDTILFSDKELKILDAVCTTFGSYSSRELSALTHKESAWINHCQNQEFIPFEEAFALKTNPSFCS